MKKIRFYSLNILGILCGSAMMAGVNAANAETDAIISSSSDKTSQSSATVDYQHAKPRNLPTLNRVLSPTGAMETRSSVLSGNSGSSAGSIGNGQQNPVQVPESVFTTSASDIAPQEYGTYKHPYTTSRVNAFNNNTASRYPYRATGRLYFNIGADTYVCSASLIKAGVIVTAAHCVTDFGSQTFFKNFRFVPAYNRGVAPYGVWRGQTAYVMASYFNGTAGCAVSGVVCPNDVAVIKLAPQYDPYIGGSYYVGKKTGYYGYGWNGYGFVNNGNQVLTQISQLGYPVALDNGGVMQRTDSYGYVDNTYSKNTVIGSLQSGGSSGGPWLVNLGMTPVLKGTSFGSDSLHNIVVGVTSWGYVSDLPKEVGASPFTSGNIVPLINAVCSTYPGACK